MDSRFEPGAKVYVVNDPKHIGTVEITREDLTRVRWHKGYNTWESTHMLRTA